METIFRNASLDIIVPEASNAKLPEALEDIVEVDADDNTSLIPIQQRTRLFFDERLTAFVVIRIPQDAQKSLEEILPRLDLNLEVRISNSQHVEPQRERNAHGLSDGEVVFSEKIPKENDPFVILNEPEESGDESGPMMLAIWELQAFLHRPRLRFPKPVVSFTASASLAPVKTDEDGDTEDESLPSLMPGPANLFDYLKNIPALVDNPPYLPASRVESVLPGPQLEREALRIRHQPLKSFPISPAVSARVRYTRMTNSRPRPTSIASLDFEVTPFSTFEVALTKVTLSLSSDGRIDPLGELPLPMKCRPRDVVTFLYKVEPPKEPTGAPIPLPSVSSSPVGLIDVELVSILRISPTCRPEIKMSWRSTVDFSTPIDPRFGPSSQTLQRPNRPTSLPFSSTTGTTIQSSSTRTMTPPKEARPVSLATDPTSEKPAATSGGLTISFTAPPTVPLGHIFPLTLLITNNSPRPLKLALIPLTRRPPSSVVPPRKHAPRPSSTSTLLDKRHSSSSTTAKGQDQRLTDVAPAVIDENIIYALQKAGVNNTTDTDLVAVSADVRVGPIGTGSCHEVKLKLLGLRVGIWRLDAVRVVDLGKEQEARREGSAGVGNAVMDVRGDLLPEIVVVEGTGRERPVVDEAENTERDEGSILGKGKRQVSVSERIKPKVVDRDRDQERGKEKGKMKRRVSKV